MREAEGRIQGVSLGGHAGHTAKGRFKASVEREAQGAEIMLTRHSAQIVSEVKTDDHSTSTCRCVNVLKPQAFERSTRTI